MPSTLPRPLHSPHLAFRGMLPPMTEQHSTNERNICATDKSHSTRAFGYPNGLRRCHPASTSVHHRSRRPETALSPAPCPQRPLRAVPFGDELTRSTTSINASSAAPRCPAAPRPPPARPRSRSTTAPSPAASTASRTASSGSPSPSLPSATCACACPCRTRRTPARTTRARSGPRAPSRPRSRSSRRASSRTLLSSSTASLFPISRRTVSASVAPFESELKECRPDAECLDPGGCAEGHEAACRRRGFEFGGTSTYNGSAIVSRSVEMNTPVVYVSMNYRLTVFGFLAGQEVKEAGIGNLGMQDQRLALRWIQKYISAFNGDPSKVTIFGESAGSISVALHMLANGGNPGGLFRAAFMESGSPVTTNTITHGQPTYDTVVSQVGCSGAADTLECLRQAPYQALLDAANASPGFFSPLALNLVWEPLIDGVFLTDDPQKLVARGAIADVPFVNGDCDDEGTLFTIQSLNITTDAEVRDYLTEIYIPNTTPAQLDTLLEIYPQDPAQGSPFGTGDDNALSPQFKRLAAIQGDLFFQGPRRFLLNNRASKQPTYSYINKRLKSTPGLGSAHATDILNMYGPGDMTDYLINFASTLNPNGAGLLNWPAYTTAGKQLLTFLDGTVPLAITKDDFRTNGTDLLTQLLQVNPLGGGVSS